MLHSGFEVTISCDGNALPEYDTKIEDEGKAVACYIPSETGKQFKVCWRYIGGQATASVRSFIDGRYVGGTVSSPGEHNERWGVRTSLTARKPFEFSSLVLTDDDDLMSTAGAHPDLGIVEVKIFRVVRLGVSSKDSFAVEQVSAIGPVHERSKKAGAHCVALGEAQHCPPAPRARVRALDPPDEPLVRFIFRYRPRDLLQAQGIMPAAKPAKAQLSTPGAGPSRKRAAESSLEGATKNVKHHKSASSFSEDVKPDISRLAKAAAPKQGRPGKKVGQQPVKREPMPERLQKDDIIDLTMED